MTGPRRASSRTILATPRMQSVVASEEQPNLRIFVARNQCSRERDEDRSPPQILSAHVRRILAIARGESYHRLMATASAAFSNTPRLRRALFYQLRELLDWTAHLVA